MTVPTLLRYALAAPVSLVGVIAGALARLSGASATRRDGVLEVCGGGLAHVLPRLGIGVTPRAMALGHVVIAVDADPLDQTRAHERVHVRQFERWGPIFPFAYALTSVVPLARGGDAYVDNVFEQDARAAEG